MTLQDLIEFLCDETERQTLTEQAITRCVLLAFDLGMAAGEARMAPPAPAHPADRGEATKCTDAPSARPDRIR